jgi:hypothetical protein
MYLCPSLSSILDKIKIKVKLKCHKIVAWEGTVECETKCGCQFESAKGWMIEDKKLKKTITTQLLSNHIEK